MFRRKFLLTACAAAIITKNDSFAEDGGGFKLLGEIPPLPTDLAPFANRPPAPIILTDPVGTATPTTAEIDLAIQVLFDAPYDCKPIDVAAYFLRVGNGTSRLGADVRHFAREWPVRANPVIYHFFTATKTKPAGDTTAWCAAFTNWCILRSKAKVQGEIGDKPDFFTSAGLPFQLENMRKYSSNSASSGSFRCFTEIRNPQTGDLVVLADAGTSHLSEQCRGTGHVGFYVDHDSEWVTVLGGNQTAPGTGGAVTEARYRITGDRSRFFRFAALRA